MHDLLLMSSAMHSGSRMLEDGIGTRIAPRVIYPVAAGMIVIATLLAAAGFGERAAGLSDWQALALGAVQGVTELLPISSSGHLILVPWLADWHYLEAHPDFNKTFDVALHLGTLIAVAAYFWRDLAQYVGAWLSSLRRRKITTAKERIAWSILLATLPAALAGALGEDLIEQRLGQPWQIAILLAAFGVILWFADRLPQQRNIDQLGIVSGFLIGVSQTLALIPGVSRSGITITAGRVGGLDRDSAARFSFLLLIPVVFGAVAYKGLQHVILQPLPPGAVGPFLTGTLAAAGVGLVAIDLLLSYVRKHDYTPFALYRVVIAAFVLVIIATGIRSAGF
jgi:undecaprenyl-diphosphatase